MITYTFLLVLNCTESNAAKTSSEGLEIKKTIFFGGGVGRRLRKEGWKWGFELDRSMNVHTPPKKTFVLLG